MLRRLIILVGTAAAAGALALAGAAHDTAGTCVHWAGPGGSDAGAGTRSAPYATVSKLLGTLLPGQTGCLEPGASFDEHVVVNVAGTASAPITLMSAPNEQGATLLGGLEFTEASHDVIVRRVAIRATALPAGIDGIVYLRGLRNAIVGSDIDGSDTPDRSQSCIVLDHANHSIVDHDAIRACSRAVSQPGIYSAGIRDAVSVGARITNNVITNQHDDAIALAPDAQYTTVSRNLMRDNGSGVYFGGGAKAASSDNVVSNNAIGPSTSFGVHADYAAGSPTGRRNVVRHNCLWQAGTAELAPAAGADPGFTATANVAANPLGKACASDRPAAGGAQLQRPAAKPAPHAKPKPRPKPAPASATPLGSGLGFLAGAEITGPRVTVVEPSVVGLVAGATVSIRCTRGCALSEVLHATGYQLASRAFSRATLHLGDEVEVRATAPGYLGRVADFVVKPSVADGAFHLQSAACLRGAKRVACP